MAITARLLYTRGQDVIVRDGDLQDPPPDPRGWLVPAFAILFLSVSTSHAVRQARSWAPSPPLCSGSPSSSRLWFALLLAAGVLLQGDAIPFVVPFVLVRGLVPASAAAAGMVPSASLPMDIDYYPQHFLHPKIAQIPFILRTVGSEWISLKHWSILWIAILPAPVLHARSLRREDARLLFPAAFQLGAYAFVWMSFPIELGRFCVRVQDMRRLLHVTPSRWLRTVWRLWRPSGFFGSRPALS